ncbi:MAG: hypothetical protein HQL79_10980 [Magnetococcales bacterium]|nr:hypothetical protein [Magnetococcales bacterium]
MEFSSDTEESLALEQTWYRNSQPPTPAPKKALIQEIARSLLYFPEELADPLLHIPAIAWKKRQLFRRYRAAIHALLWLWALQEIVPDRAYALLQAVEPLYTAPGTTPPAEWRQVMADIDFFRTILDNYREEGFLSIAQHVTWRVHGDFVQNPELLEVAVALSFHIDQKFDELRAWVYRWAGRPPTPAIDRVTSLLETEAFSGNF